jgi:hypothetical protein
MTASLVASSNLFDFFRDRIAASMERQAFCLSDQTSWYLASLLVDYASTKSLLDADGQPVTLAEMLYQARSSEPNVAFQTYKRMGDYSLVLTGFFRRSLTAKTIDLSYYQAMGGTAYQVLADLVRSPGQTFAEIFGELASSYTACSELLADVGDTTKDHLSEGDLLRLYKDYQSTGSPRAAATLRAHGFRIDNDPDDTF